MVRPSISLERQFAEELKETNKMSAKLGYFSPEFDAMLKIHGGVNTATRLVGAGTFQSGMRKVCKLGHPELTTEAVMLRPEFQSLFSKSQLECARWRLEQMGF